MFPIYASDTNATLISGNTNTTPFRHARKLSHVQFGKKSTTQDDYNTSSSLMIPFDELQKKSGTLSLSVSSEEEESTAVESKELPVQKKRHWMLSSAYWGPLSKGNQWPLFTYLMVAFTIIIFSGELLLSRQESGEFIELEPFNYMLGPSMEIMIQVGARFPPCMRHVDSMPPEERYVCLHTIAEKNKTPAAAAAAAANVAAISSGNSTGQPLLLLDPVVDLADPRLLNSSCSLASICGMTSFQQHHVPDQTYRLLTPLFIHTGIVHLAINLLMLVLLGSKVERIINSVRFTVLYLGSGVFGHALGANFAPPTTPFLGCSSALLGLIGFLYVDLIANWKTLEQPVRHLITLLIGTAFSFVLGILPGVDNFSHMGGLAAGVLLSVCLMPPFKKASDKKTKVAFYLIRLLFLCIYSLLLGILIHHFNNSKIDEECPYCRYLSCLPINGFCD